MADEISTLLGTSDLLNFNNSVRQSDPYGITGAALGNVQFDTSTWDPQTTAISSFAKSFLSGLLGNYANQRASDQLSSVVSALPNLKSDPYNTAVPEGVDPGAFNVLKGSAILKKSQNDELSTLQKKKDIADLLKSVVGEGVKNGTIGTGDAVEAVATGNYSKVLGAGVDPLNNPNSPQYKTSQDKIATERSLANDFNARAKDFKYKEQTLKALTEAYKDTGGTSDFEIIRRGAQMVEPNLAVRADDEASLQGAASALGMSFQAVKNAISGDTKLDPNVRAGIMRIAKRGYESSLEDYNTTRNSFLDRARDANVNKLAVVPYGEGKPFQSLYPDLNIGATGVTGGNAIDVELARRGLGPDGLPLGSKTATVSNSLFGLK
jgi:hypothetical protein